MFTLFMKLVRNECGPLRAVCIIPVYTGTTIFVNKYFPKLRFETGMESCDQIKDLRSDFI